VFADEIHEENLVGENSFQSISIFVEYNDALPVLWLYIKEIKFKDLFP
jgi:hypothetical protein